MTSACVVLSLALIGSAQSVRSVRATHIPVLTAQNAMRVDLNTASADELQLLPRIGPALSVRIVESRRDDGPFESIDDLTRVRGIGPATLQRVRPHATLTTRTP
ncbi:MAG: ComEA family DNA-binding protein [Phycisphaerales bacterium JB043]